MPSTPEKPSKGPMWRGVIVAYIIVAICYLPVAFIGFWAFGNRVDDNILVTLEKPVWLIATANIFVVIHVIGSYQIFAMPVFDMIESFLLPCFMWLSICKPKRFSSTWFINWICISLGVLLMVLSPIGGLRSIIVSAKDYKFFS
ncbi:hypothetical protein V6N13_135111 [Hibiscus sabdariffa]